MNSIERREARYQRRRAARMAKKEEMRKACDDYPTVFCYANLYNAYKQCRKNVAWKSSVQRYITNAPLNVLRTHKELMAGKFKSPGFFEFDLYERGKHRHIRSTVISERIVQRCLCDNALVPVLGRSFIYDNGACMKNKGYDFAFRRMVRHLQKHYRLHGNEGYILLFDFSKFFDNVSHELIKEDLRNRFSDEQIFRLTEMLIDAFGDKGMGLGSQISQVLALASANCLDHFVKEKLRIKGYGRYMDDGYLIHSSKEYLQECLKKIKAVCIELGITLNEKKTQIVKISHGFKWLQSRVFLTDSGKVIKKICKKSIVRERRKLKKLKKRLLEKKMTFDDIYQSWQSWRAYAAKFDSWKTVQSMAKLYENLFINDYLEVYENEILQAV